MRELISRAQDGDKKALEELIKENEKLIWSIVRRFNNRNVPLEDLFELGCMGFIKAIKRFDFNFETRLSTYAVPMIIGEIKRFIRDNGPIKVSRALKELATSARELRDRLTMEEGKEISLEELARRLNVDKEDIVVALDATSCVESIDKKIGDDDFTFGDKLASSKDEFEVVVNKATIEKLIDILDEREKKIIIYRYYKELTQTQIAKLMGTSQVQVSRIEKKALEKMREKLS